MLTESSAFDELRPLCIQLSRITFQPQELFDPESAHLLRALKNLESKLHSFNEKAFSQNLADYLFVPIASLLKHKGLGRSQTEVLLLIISHLLRLCWRQTGTFPKELSQQLLPLINFLISPDGKNVSLKKSSVSFKKTTGHVYCEFFLSLANQTYSQSYLSTSNSKSHSGLGHCVAILLDVLESTCQSPEIQLEVLKTLLNIFQNIMCDGETLSFILPGNVSSFCKLLAMPGLTVNYKVVSKTLEVFAVLLTLVYDDFSLNIKKKGLASLNAIRDIEGNLESVLVERTIIEDGVNIEGMRQHRNTSWLRATSYQVKIALDGFIPKLKKRDNPEINRAAANFSSEILLKCSSSLSNCELLLVSTLIMLKLDPKYILTSHMNCVIKVIKGYISSLNHMVQFEDELGFESLIFALNVAKQGNFAYEDFGVGEILTAIKDTVDPLFEQQRMYKHGQKVLEQSSNVFLTAGFEDEVLTSTTESISILPKISSRMQTLLSHTFMSLSKISIKSDSLRELVEVFLSENATVSLSEKAVTLWISAWLVKGLNLDDVQNGEFEFLGDCKKTKIDTTVCYEILEYSDELAHEVVAAFEGVALDRDGEFELCTVLLSVETACTVLGKDFKFELIDHIYTVIENLASGSPVVRSFAQACSRTIAHEIYQGSVRDMILDNIDYLAESVAARLNSGMTERVSTVLTVICKMAGYDVIDTFKDIFETIFKLIDYYHGYGEMCEQFFQLFEIVILEMKKKYFSSTNDNSLLGKGQSEDLSSYAPWGITTIDGVLSILDKENGADDSILNSVNYESAPKDFQQFLDSKIREVDSDDEDEDSSQAEFPSNEMNNKDKESIEWVSPIPQESYRVLLQIWNYGDRLLTHQSRSLRIRILKVIKLVVPMLASQYDSLLPQIAQSWDTVVECSVDNDLSVVSCACSCLEEMIHYSRDFIMKRFVDLWATWQSNSVLLRELRPGMLHSGNKGWTKHVVPHNKARPPLVLRALTSMCDAIMQGISVTGLMLSDETAEDMIYCCLQVLPIDSVAQHSIVSADIVYGITHQEDE